MDNLRGREVQTEGGSRLGTVEDVLLDGELRVLGFELGKVCAQGLLAEKKAIVREALRISGAKTSL